MTDEADDARLVALIDGQLDESSRQALQTRLMVEPDLRARYRELAAGGLPFRAAFQAALAEAPVARMQARLEAIDGARPAPPPRRRLIAAAAAAVALFLAGWAVGHYLPAPGPLAPIAAEDRDDWRQAVASYVALYTPETFAGAGRGSDPAALTRLSRALGVALTPDAVALPDLAVKWADLLVYDGAPLGQIVYLDGGDPIVFCVIGDGQKDAPIETETREGVAIASWARGGRGFLVGGRVSKERATQLAGMLAPRF